MQKRHPLLSARSLGAVVLTVLLNACAVHYAPVQLQLADVPSALPQRTLAQGAAIQFQTGYSRELKAGSVWRPIGSLSEGTVYRPVNDVFTVEGAHIHEAYLVVQSDQLVGFYLPAERGFSPLKPILALQFK